MQMSPFMLTGRSFGCWSLHFLGSFGNFMKVSLLDSIRQLFSCVGGSPTNALLPSWYGQFLPYTSAPNRVCLNLGPAPTEPSPETSESMTNINHLVLWFVLSGMLSQSKSNNKNTGDRNTQH